MIVFGTDFDDTLYFHDENGVRKEDVEAIRRFQKTGSQFGLVSGRSRTMWKQIDAMLKGAVDFDFKIYSNGACICDKDNNILWQTFLPADVVEDIANKADAAGLSLILHGEDALYVTHELRPDLPGSQYIQILCEIDPAKIYAISFNNTSTETGRQFYQDLQDYSKAILVANSRFADFNPLGVTKGSALNRLAHMMHETRDTSAAIGDSYNDMAMLKDADVSFTFHSSPKEVRECATHLVDGIAEAVDILLEEDKAK